jgi:hypothetical protein
MLADLEDVETLARYSWFPVQNRNATYAAATIDGRRVFAHRLLLSAPDEFDPTLGKWRAVAFVDHVNGNTLDNRRCNLRIATRSENQRNTRGRPRHRKSRFKGLSFYPSSVRPWRATIEVGGRQLHLGYFATELDAAMAYNLAASTHFGAFAYLNSFEPLAA